MKIKEFKKLEKKITNYNFNESYRSINGIMTVLSYFGHVASIFLAFFFMSKIISGAISDNEVAVIISSLIILGGLELLKRDIFDKFSIQSLKEEKIGKNTMPLFLASVLLIFFSFYSTINGAKEFSSKADEIEQVTDESINNFSDSLTLYYKPKIEILEKQNIELFESNKLLDEEARELPSNYIAAKNKIRQRIDVNNDQIEKNDTRIANIKNERDSKIDEYRNKAKSKSGQEKEENSKNSFLFVIISTLIELVILGGVYFNEYYKFRSFKEFRDKIENDPNYQKWLLYDQILTAILTEETKVNQKLPANKLIIDMCKINDVIVLQKDLTDFVKVMTSLGIIKASGNVKYISKTKEIAQETLRKHFNII
jgi:hypothetical protein